MSRILITSGPTRQYLDPVRYLTNSSSGKMGCALAEAALSLGHEVVVVTGPVELEYPSAARVHHVLTTDEMLFTCQREFPQLSPAASVAGWLNPSGKVAIKKERIESSTRSSMASSGERSSEVQATSTSEPAARPPVRNDRRGRSRTITNANRHLSMNGLLGG